MDEIVILIRKLMRNLCLNEAPCKIYSILALSEKPMSIREISERTGYSPTIIYSSIKSQNGRNPVETLQTLERISDDLGIPEDLRETAAIIYRKAMKNNMVRGRSIETLLAASIYAACRDDQHTKNTG